MRLVQHILHAIIIVYGCMKTNCQCMVSDTRRQMAVGVGFLMHDELSHLLVWLCKARGQGKFSRKQEEASSENKQTKAWLSSVPKVTDLFIVQCHLWYPSRSKNPAGTWGQSRWQSLSRCPGEETLCQNRGLRSQETASEIGKNP